LLFVGRLLGSAYISNSIGQKIDSIADGSDISRGWILEEAESGAATTESRLYLDGQMQYLTVVTSELGPVTKKTVIHTDYTNPSNSIKTRSVFENGRPVSITESQNDTLKIQLFSYDNNRLVSKRVIEDGRLTMITEFWRLSDGSLAGGFTIDANQNTLVSFVHADIDGITFAEGSQDRFTIITIPDLGPVLSSVWQEHRGFSIPSLKRDDEGNLVVSKMIDNQFVTTAYDQYGSIVEETFIENDKVLKTISYQYDEHQNLLKMTETTGESLQNRVERWYDGGTVRSSIEWLSDVKVKEVVFAEEGTSVVTLYDRGEPYVDVRYANDGRTVLSITYR